VYKESINLDKISIKEIIDIELEISAIIWYIIKKPKKNEVWCRNGTEKANQIY